MRRIRDIHMRYLGRTERVATGDDGYGRMYDLSPQTLQYIDRSFFLIVHAIYIYI